MRDGVESRRAVLEERIRLAEQDLADLAIQVEEGDLAATDASALEDRYREDLADALNALKGLPRREKAGAPSPGAARPDTTGPAKGPGRSGVKVLAVGVAVMVALTIGIVLVAQGGGDDESTAVAPAPPPAAGSLAELVADVEADPGNNRTRLALADAYFEAGEYLDAMNHYSTVTANDPTDEEASIANARIGWMVYSSLGNPEGAVEFLETSIAQDPRNGEAKLMMGLVLLRGMQDGDAAAPFFEQVLQTTGLPAEFRSDVELLLGEARGGGQ